MPEQHTGMYDTNEQTTEQTCGAIPAAAHAAYISAVPDLGSAQAPLVLPLG